MDAQVIAAMARWPDVPDVFGWLSLNATGHWRLHPDGQALAQDQAGQVDAGVPVSNQKINQFINQNYAHDTRHRWFFQNGPQRVYVRLDVAPFILYTVDQVLRQPVFVTHNGVRTQHVRRWCLDDRGYLYAETEAGSGLVAGRDLEQVINRLTTTRGEPVTDVLAQVANAQDIAPFEVCWPDGSQALFYVSSFEQIPELLGFVRCPRP